MPGRTACARSIENEGMESPITPPSIQYPSAQSLRIEMRFGETVLSTGTAFVATSAVGPLLITNRHNVTGRHQDTGDPLSKNGGLPDNILVWYHRTVGQVGDWVGYSHSLFSQTGSPLWIEHPALGKRADFVALRVPRVADIAVNPYDPSSPGPDILVGPAEPVSVVGFPLDIRVNGFVPVWATGFIASEPTIDVDGLPMFLIDCRTRPGQSGSPVIAFRSGSATHSGGAFSVGSGPTARFLGIYSGRVHKDSDLGKVWKASAIAELVNSVQPTFSISTISNGLANYMHSSAIKK